LYSETKLNLKENWGCGRGPHQTFISKIAFFVGKTNLIGGRGGLRLGLRARRKVSSFRQV